MSIFHKKKHNNNVTNNTISRDEIMSSIPPTAYEKENTELADNCTEYRWRIFKLPNNVNEIIEISQKKKEQRLFMSRNGTWMEYNINNIKDMEKYIIKTYYYYDKSDMVTQ